MTKKLRRRDHAPLQVGTTLAFLCTFALSLCPQAAQAQVRLATVEGESAQLNLGERVLMVNGELFASAEDAQGFARFFRWSIPALPDGTPPSYADLGPLGDTSDEVLVGRHHGTAFMSVGDQIAYYTETSAWSAGIIAVHGSPAEEASIHAVVRRNTGGTFGSRLPRVYTDVGAYAIDFGSEAASLDDDARGTMSGSPNLIQTEGCLYVSRGSELFCVQESGDEVAVALPALPTITQVDASDTYIALIAGSDGYLFSRANPPVLVDRFPGATNLVLTERRLAVAFPTIVWVFLRRGTTWCEEASMGHPGPVASMDFSENQEQLLMGVPSHSMLFVTGLNLVGDANCTGATLPLGEVGSDAGVGDASSGDGGIVWVERADLSCTCRVGGEAPTPLAMGALALGLGLVARRRVARRRVARRRVARRRVARRRVARRR